MEQLTLSFEPGISRKYQSLLECITAGVYRTGLTRVAGKLDTAPSNLSAACSGSQGRHFGVDQFEAYITAFGDLDPVYYLVDKFLTNGNARTKAEALANVNRLTVELQTAIRNLKD